MNKMNAPETVEYIVSSDAPQNGQKASSGGIRENGKLRSQYKNPRPYNPTDLTRLDDYIAASRSCQNERIKSEFKSLLWKELGKPLTKKCIQWIAERISSAFDARQEPIPVHQVKPDKTESKLKPTAYTAENVIPFPTERIS